MKKLVCLLVAIVALSCAHAKPIEKAQDLNVVFCRSANLVFEEFLLSYQIGLRAESGIVNVTIIDKKITCENKKASLTWVTVIEVRTSAGNNVCGKIEASIYFENDQIIYDTDGMKGPEEVECLPAS